jgi:hypothetical protein
MYSKPSYVLQGDPGYAVSAARVASIDLGEALPGFYFHLDRRRQRTTFGRRLVDETPGLRRKPA